MSSSPFRPERGDGPDGPSGEPGGHGLGDYHSGIGSKDLDAFEAAVTASEQRPTTGDDRPADSYTPTSYQYPTPRPGGELGF
jgi:hypothetical protein